MNALFSVGAKEPLKPEDLPNIPPDDQAENLSDKMERLTSI